VAGAAITYSDIVNGFEAALNVPRFPDTGDQCVSCVVGQVPDAWPFNLQLSCNAVLRDPAGSPSGIAQLYFIAGVWPISAVSGTLFPTTGALSPNPGYTNTPTAFTVTNQLNSTSISVLTPVHNVKTANDCNTGPNVCAGGLLVINWCRSTDPNPDALDFLAYHCISN
jgi:hypothetical protein